MLLEEMVQRFDPERYEADRWLYYEITGDRVMGYSEINDIFYQGDSSDKDCGGGGGANTFLSNDDQDKCTSRLISGSKGKSIEPKIN